MKKKINLSQKKVIVADSVKERFGQVVKVRVPWLLLGLLGGLITTKFISNFENILASNIALAFFLPIVVYMADAIGTQTEEVFVRRLAFGPVHFLKYLLRELIVGLFLGVILGILIGGVATVWMGDFKLGLVVGVAMFINVMLAPLMAMLIPEFLFKEHVDPAVGAGPFTTVIQDGVSVLVYLAVASIILG